MAGTCSSIQRASASASPESLQMKQDALVILSAITYVLQPPDSAIAFAPRCTEAVRPPSVCARGTTTSSSARPVSTTSPSSDNSYSPSETASWATETGIDTRPVTDSAARTYGSTSTSGRPSADWRARTESGSFLRESRIERRL